MTGIPEGFVLITDPDELAELEAIKEQLQKEGVI